MSSPQDRALRISDSVEGHELANSAIRMLHEVTAAAVAGDDEQQLNSAVEARHVLNLLTHEQAKVALFVYIARDEREAASAAADA